MFIGRKADGSIYGVWTVRQWKDQEELPDNSAEVVAFVNRPLPQIPPQQKLDAFVAANPDVAPLIVMAK